MFRILCVDSQVIYGSSMIVCPIVICSPWCIAFFSELLVAIHRSRCVSRVSMALCLELVVARFCPLVFLIVVVVSLFCWLEISENHRLSLVPDHDHGPPDSRCSACSLVWERQFDARAPILAESAS